MAHLRSRFKAVIAYMYANKHPIVDGATKGSEVTTWMRFSQASDHVEISVTLRLFPLDRGTSSIDREESSDTLIVSGSSVCPLMSSCKRNRFKSTNSPERACFTKASDRPIVGFEGSTGTLSREILAEVAVEEELEGSGVEVVDVGKENSEDFGSFDSKLDRAWIIADCCVAS